MIDTSDIQLVEQSLAGNRDAFGHIVERYRGLVAGVTYERCQGDLCAQRRYGPRGIFNRLAKAAPFGEPSFFGRMAMRNCPQCGPLVVAAGAAIGPCHERYGHF